jgi:hypothetical protein
MISLVVSGLPASAQSILLDPITATYGNPWVTPRTPVISSGSIEIKVLVTTSALPAEGEFKVLGPLNVQSRWPGFTSKATKLLAEKARNMGANVVVEARTWQAPAFPAGIAPHGSGIAVRIVDEDLLHSLVDSGSTWE